jgi:hypothetical protein
MCLRNARLGDAQSPRDQRLRTSEKSPKSRENINAQNALYAIFRAWAIRKVHLFKTDSKGPRSLTERSELSWQREATADPALASLEYKRGWGTKTGNSIRDQRRFERFGSYVGRTPRPRRTPWSGLLRRFREADEGVGRGPGGPPHTDRTGPIGSLPCSPPP